jgi:hypothetical protein
MKKIILALLLLPLLSAAQSFKTGQLALNLGVGFGTTFIGSGTYNRIPPISASLDYGLTDQISLGGYFGFSGASWRWTGSDYCNNGNGVGGGFYAYEDIYRYRYYIFGVRGAYHFAEFIDNDKVDLYLGLMLGFNAATSKFTTTSPCPRPAYVFNSGGGFIFSAFAGCRYRFTEQFGAFAELGYGIAVLNIGLNVKLR